MRHSVDFESLKEVSERVLGSSGFMDSPILRKLLGKIKMVYPLNGNDSESLSMDVDPESFLFKEN